MQQSRLRQPLPAAAVPARLSSSEFGDLFLVNFRGSQRRDRVLGTADYLVTS
jgi:hypothetical protein